MKAIQLVAVMILSLLMLADAVPQPSADHALVNADGLPLVNGKRQAPGEECLINCDTASGDIPEGGNCSSNFDFGIFFGDKNCGYVPCTPPPCERGLECNIPDDAEACTNNCIASWSGTCGAPNTTAMSTPRRRSVPGFTTNTLRDSGNVTLSPIYGVSTCTNTQDENYVCATVDTTTGQYFFICEDPEFYATQEGVCYSMCYADKDAPCSCYWLGSEWCSNNWED